MGSKKIDGWAAKNIAERVAKKAFEHLCPGLEQQQQDLAQAHYDAWHNDLNLGAEHVTRLIKLNVIDSYDGCTVEYTDKKRELSVSLGTSGYRYAKGPDDGFGKYLVSVVLIEDAGHIKAMKALAKKIAPLHERRDAMATKIANQITGKTPAYVMKQWPEIRGFIEDYFSLDKGETMIVPFEQLINTYLLALPAPQVEEAQTV
jgi:hypothetical protein